MPRELTPAFYGCLDWHSAVHSHWLLARALRLGVQGATGAAARALLDRHLTLERCGAELRFVAARPGFERPYGLAWMLRLHQELCEWDDPDAERWARAVEPLARLSIERLVTWLGRLGFPIRSGVHAQSAFAMGLALDWARSRGEARSEAAICERARAFHGGDRDVPLHLEPSGEDFLSPALGAADLMGRVLPASELARWLEHALPALAPEGCAALEPVFPGDRSDGRLAHLDGLNLSRAWMLLGLAAALPGHDGRCAMLRQLGAAHAVAGLRAVQPGEYMGTHWLGSFALYLLSEVPLPEEARVPPP